jgi:hypothetical protein
MNKKLSILLIGFFLCNYLVHASEGSYVSGTVYIDVNANGIQDKSEKGIKNIPVSNGTEIVLTDQKGYYRLQCAVGCSVFPILPAGYTFPKRGGNVPNANFYYAASLESGGVINFGLHTIPINSRFSLAAVGDIQVGNEDEVGYAAKSVATELSAPNVSDINLLLGDLVNDNPPLMPIVKTLLNTFNSPTWTVYGNHDREERDSTTSDAAYNKVFGASVYAFNKGEVHFIILNNVSPKGRLGYEGRLSENQLRFVENDLRLVPKERLIVIAQHIPLAFTSNKEKLLALLSDRSQVLVLTGHTHTVARYFHRYKLGVIPELGVGASCGTWWTGEKNEQGVPNALMQCGSLPNYFIIDFNRNQYAFHYKAIGTDASYQTGVWTKPAKLSSVDAKDSLVSQYIEITANVFGGSDSTIVSLQIDSLPTMVMQKKAIISPNVANLIELYGQKVYPTPNNTRIPLRKKASPHIWQANVPALKPGIHIFKIKAEDKYGLKVENNKPIFLPETR